MERLEYFSHHARKNFNEVQEVVLSALKIKAFFTIAANLENKRVNRYLNKAWSKRGGALKSYMKIRFTKTRRYFIFRLIDVPISLGTCGRETFLILIRRMTIDYIWRHTFMIPINTRELIINKAWE